MTKVIGDQTLLEVICCLMGSIARYSQICTVQKGYACIIMYTSTKTMHGGNPWHHPQGHDEVLGLDPWVLWNGPKLVKISCFPRNESRIDCSEKPVFWVNWQNKTIELNQFFGSNHWFTMENGFGHDVNRQVYHGLTGLTTIKRTKTDLPIQWAPFCIPKSLPVGKWKRRRRWWRLKPAAWYPHNDLVQLWQLRVQVQLWYNCGITMV